MNRCPITYEPCGDNLYSEKGLHLLSRNLNKLNPFPYTKDEQINEAVARSVKMSIQGVQPKLSAKLSIKNEIFEIVDRGGTFILKPQNLYYKELPQNEDLTMKLADIGGLEVPLHGMIYSKDGSLTYFIKRFDRTPRGRKIAVEDFAQLTGSNRDNKYGYSMEKAAGILERFCTFPVLEKIKFFKLVVFNFLMGNEDSHLKNFSLITRDGKIELSPCYDLLNTTIAVSSKEEIALTIDGRKKNLTGKIFIEYFGKKRLGLNDKVIENSLNDFRSCYNTWLTTINNSYLSDELKSSYIVLLDKRKSIINI